MRKRKSWAALRVDARSVESMVDKFLPETPAEDVQGGGAVAKLLSVCGEAESLVAAVQMDMSHSTGRSWRTEPRVRCPGGVGFHSTPRD